MAEIKDLAGPQSRRRFLAVGGGSAGLAAFLAACGGDSDTTMTTDSMGSGGGSETAQFGKGDVGILNYALTLEYLETAFYTQVLKNKVLSGPTLRFAR